MIMAESHRGEGAAGEYLSSLFSLHGKTALVTGASRGLGRAMAEALGSAGAALALVASNAERLEETRNSLGDAGVDAHVYAHDLSDMGGISPLVDKIAADCGRIDVLVNAAGITKGHDALTYPPALWRSTLAVNLDAPFELARCCAAVMKKHGGGSIINVTSVNAEVGFPGNPAYIAAKGALRQLTKALALDWGKYRIRVNAIGPGYFRTDMTGGSWNDPALRQQRADRTMLGRWGEPQELAGLTLLLASDASSYITGQSFYIDGGWLAKGL